MRFYFTAVMMGPDTKITKRRIISEIILTHLLPEKIHPRKSQVGTKLKTQRCRNLVRK